MNYSQVGMGAWHLLCARELSTGGNPISSICYLQIDVRAHSARHAQWMYRCNIRVAGLEVEIDKLARYE